MSPLSDMKNQYYRAANDPLISIRYNYVK